MKKIKRRKCLHCRELYHPDPRAKDRQIYCSAPECKRVSKRSRQQIWLQKPENKDYFTGSDQVDRVRAWREKNPGYWKKPLLPEKPLQDDSQAQTVETEQDSFSLASGALQDEILTQSLEAKEDRCSLVFSALQDDILVQDADVKQDGSYLNTSAQQSDFLMQHALLVGFIAHINQCTLYDDLVPVLRNLQALGQQILGVGPGLQPKEIHHIQTVLLSRSPAPSASAVQLDHTSPDS